MNKHIFKILGFIAFGLFSLSGYIYVMNFGFDALSKPNLPFIGVLALISFLIIITLLISLNMYYVITYIKAAKSLINKNSQNKQTTKKQKTS